MTPFHVFLAVLVVVIWGIAFVAAYAPSLVFGERLGALRLAGMGLVLLGLAAIVLPLERRPGHRPSP